MNPFSLKTNNLNEAARMENIFQTISTASYSERSPTKKSQYLTLGCALVHIIKKRGAARWIKEWTPERRSPPQ